MVKHLEQCSSDTMVGWQKEHGSEGLNRQSPSRVAGMASSVEPSGGLLKLDNQKLYVWLGVLSSM